MFQFYEELKYYDQTFQSVFMQHSFSASDDLKVEFLKNWDKRSDMKNIKDWDLDEDVINRSQFIEQFEKFSPEGIQFGGGPGVLSKFRVRSQVFIPFYYVKDTLKFIFQ